MMLVRTLLTYCLLALMAMSSALAAAADPRDETAQFDTLAAIRVIAEESNTKALEEANKLLASLPADASYDLRHRVLKATSRLASNAGNIKLAFRLDEQLVQLATAANDRDTASIARFYRVAQLLYSNNASKALIELKKQEADMAPGASPQLLYTWHFEACRTYLTLGKPDLALAHALKALDLAAQQGANADAARMSVLSMISRLYSTLKNPEKALATADAALAEPIARKLMRPVASLHYTRGVALSALGRHAEALAASQRALQMSVAGGFGALEASVRGNISDLYLREKNYVAAEREARLALLAGHRVNDETAVLVANANIGLALGGQGKTLEAIEYIRVVIKSLRDAGSLADLEQMLDETSHMYETAKMFEQALATVREQQVVQRQVVKADREHAIASLQERFDAVQREKKIEILARESQVKDADIRNRRLQLLVSLLGGALLLVAGVFIALLYRRVRKNNLGLEKLNTQLEFHALRDPLTGLFNRRSFVNIMETQAGADPQDRRARSADPCGLVLMDIDHFKQVNDTWGHTVGDGVLVEIAARLSRTVRDTDMALRWGGEEFLFYAPGADAALLATIVARMLRSVCAEPVIVGELSIPVTLTAGFISLPFAGLSAAQCGWEKAILLIDMALYLGKKNGRNRAYGLVGMREPGAAALARIEADFLAAVEDGTVELVEVPGPAALQGVAAEMAS
jgi:diguanylate cyclase (GGDEF)-like protein